MNFLVIVDVRYVFFYLNENVNINKGLFINDPNLLRLPFECFPFISMQISRY